MYWKNIYAYHFIVFIITCFCLTLLSQTHFASRYSTHMIMSPQLRSLASHCWMKTMLWGRRKGKWKFWWLECDKVNKLKLGDSICLKELVYRNMGECIIESHELGIWGTFKERFVMFWPSDQYLWVPPQNFLVAAFHWN